MWACHLFFPQRRLTVCYFEFIFEPSTSFTLVGGPWWASLIQYFMQLIDEQLIWGENICVVGGTSRSTEDLQFVQHHHGRRHAFATLSLQLMRSDVSNKRNQAFIDHTSYFVMLYKAKKGCGTWMWWLFKPVAWKVPQEKWRFFRSEWKKWTIIAMWTTNHSTVGGILGLPHAMARLGLVAGVALLIATAGLCCITATQQKGGM